jgi:DNA ligase 1
MTPFRVTLSAHIKTTDGVTLPFPSLASVKLDGIRAYVKDGIVLSRANKPIPNLHVQRLFKDMENADSELIVGNPSAADCYRKTESAVMRADGTPAVRMYAFDMIAPTDSPFRARNRALGLLCATNSHAVHVKQLLVHDLDELLTFEHRVLAKGHEGVMLRSPDAPYKHGRSTLREAYLIALKRFIDGEAEILSAYEQETNTNAKTANAVGLSSRSSHKAGKVANGRLGGFVVRDLKTHVEFSIGTFMGVSIVDREAWWKRAHEFRGKIIKYRYQQVGGYVKPRLPIMLGFRTKEDMG